jgi:dipeptidase D
MEIHLQRGNAVKLLARAIFAAAQEVPVQLAAFQGGNKHNALPREASARVLIAAGRRGPFTAAVARETAAIRAEIRTADPDLKIEITDSELPKLAWTAEVSRRVLDLLNALPHGVLAMSNDIPGLVETSVNLATATVSGNSGNDLTLLLSLRSSVDSAMRDTKRRLRAFAELSGADFTEIEGYSGWKPDLASPLLATFRKVHEKATGHDPELKAVHAGLECGVLGEKFPGMDMISFGPVIEGAHSPDERVDVASVARFWELLKAVLAELAGAN